MSILQHISRTMEDLDTVSTNDNVDHTDNATSYEIVEIDTTGEIDEAEIDEDED